MAFEIPSARIHDLQVALRREAGFASYDPADPSLPPLPSVADALAALDPPDLSSSLRCGRCGSGGGLLHGQQSTLCVYCGADQGTQGFSHSISLYSTATCRKFLDYLGLDGSEAVQLDIEPSSSSKGQISAAPKDEVYLSDLLDLKLKWPSDKEEVNKDGTSKMPSISMYNFNMTGVDIGTFFTEPKREISPTITSKPNEQLTLRESSIITINNASTSSKNFAAFENLQRLKPEIETVNANGRQFGTSFAAWKAEFEPDHSGSLVDPKTNSGSEFVQAPESAAGFNQVEKKEQENSTKNNDGEFLKEGSSTLSINNWVSDDFWAVRPAEGNPAEQLKCEIDSREDDYRIHDSSLPTNTTEESGKPMSTKSNDDLFYESQGSAISSIARESLLGLGVQTERQPSEIKATDLGSTNNKTELELNEFLDANDDSYDDWQVASSTARPEKSVDLRTKSVVMSSELPLEKKSDHQMPVSGNFDLDDPLHLDINDDSFDDWQDFTSSNKGPEAPSNLGAQSEVTFFNHPLETNSINVLPSNRLQSTTSLNINNNGDIFDPWQGFTNSNETKEDMSYSRAQSMDILLDYSSGAKTIEISSSGSKDLDNNKLFDYNDDSFDNCQEFSSSNGQILSTDSMLSKQHSEKPSVEPWPSEPTNGSDESLDGWFEFTSSSQARGSSMSGQPTDAGLVDRSETMIACSEKVVFDSLDPLFHTPGIQNYSADRNENKISSFTSNRINNATHPDATELSSNIFENSNVASVEESGKSKIEMLMSQIPDLSFMLTDELSLPVKLDMSDSKS